MTLQIRNKPPKYAFFPFTKELHTLLIAKGFTSLVFHSKIKEVDFADFSNYNLDGYVVTAHSWVSVEDGKERPCLDAEITISRCIDLPKDPDSEIRKELIEKHPFAAQVDDILKVFGTKDDLPYRVVGWTEKAPEEKKITDLGVSYPITSHQLREMYRNEMQGLFYLLLDKGQNRRGRLLYRKITAGMPTVSNAKRLRTV